MDAVIFFTFIKENLLAVIAIIITLVFIYHYIIEKEHGVKLSKKYSFYVFVKIKPRVLELTVLQCEEQKFA